MTTRRKLLALWREAMPDFFCWRGLDLRRESASGIAGAILVIPQAITFAYLVGLAPEYGLYCAIFVALISSLFGNSPVVGGPNTAMSIMLAATVVPYAGRGSPLYLEYILLLSVMVGLIQLCIWMLRGAEVFRYLSPAAIAGIRMGVGCLLITSGLEGALGMSPLSTQFFYEKFYIAIAAWGDSVNPYAATIGGLTVISALLLRKRLPRAYILVAVCIGAVLGAIIEAVAGPVTSQVELLGHVQISPWPFVALFPSADHLLVLEEMLPSAIAIAVLGLAQSLVIARDMKNQLSSPLNLHKEVYAQGLSNVVGPFFSAFAGSGSFNRTSVAVEMGARTPLSGVIAAIAVLIIAWVLGSFLTQLPMPAVAAVLLLVGMTMIQISEIRKFLRHKIDGAVLLLTFLTVIFIGLEAGILVAAIASIVFFVISVSKATFDTFTQGDVEHITVNGNLYYATLDGLAAHLRSCPTGRTLLDLSGVSYCDLAANAMIDAVRAERERCGGQLEVRPNQ